MHFVSLALYAEGRADYDFLGPLLLRLCEDLCLNEASQHVEFAESVLALSEPDEFAGAPREERILAAARKAHGAWRVLFVHADADSDAERAHAERAQPAIVRLQQEFADGIGVAVVPVRETEAWAIADGDALRQASGSSVSDQTMGLPATRAIEATADPKAVLDKAWRIATAARLRQRRTVSAKLSYLGETVSLDRLRSLTAFQQLEQDLRQALRSLRVIPWAGTR